MLGDEAKRLPREIQREFAGGPGNPGIHGAAVGIARVEKFRGPLHPGVETLVGNVNAAGFGIASAVSQDVHILEGLTETPCEGQDFLQRERAVIGDVAVAHPRPKFPCAAGHELRVFLEFGGLERLGGPSPGGRLEAFQIENLPAQDDAPDLADVGRVGKQLERLQKLRESRDQCPLVP